MLPLRPYSAQTTHERNTWSDDVKMH
jgi:hypothetical protein